MRERRRRQRRVFALVVLVGVFGLGLVAAELALRLFAPQAKSWLEIYRRHPRLPFHGLQPELEDEVDTGENRWTVITDAHGFRTNREPPAADATRPLALWLGDSFTFAHGVDHAESWVGRLAADPRRRYRHVNAAVPALGLVHYRQILEDALAQGIAPDLVLVATYVGNDFHDCVWSKDEPVRDGVIGNRGGLKAFLKRRLHLFRFLARLRQATGVAAGPDPFRATREQLYDEASWEEAPLQEARQRYRDEAVRIGEICRERGIEVAALVIPTGDVLGPLEGEEPLGGEPLRPVDEALEAFAAAGIPAVDATQAFAGRTRAEVYFRFDGHLTPAGHGLVVDALRRECAPLRLDDSDD